MQQLSYSSSSLGLLCLLSLSACDPINSGTKAWGVTGQGTTPAPPLSTQELETKRIAEGFITALKDKKPKDLLALSSVTTTFRFFLPEGFDGDGKEESIANAAAQSEDQRLKKLSQTTFVTAYASDTPSRFLAVVAEPPPIAEQPQPLQTLEVEEISGKYRVVQIGSNAFGDGNGKWLLNTCSAFAAPFKVPAALSPKPTFEACAASLKSFTQSLTNKNPEAQRTLQTYMEGQPFLEHRKQLVAGEAKQNYDTGEDSKAFQFGLSEGETLRAQFVLAMGSYCGCLPSEKAIK
jgi:hypothetical protein